MRLSLASRVAWAVHRWPVVLKAFKLGVYVERHAIMFFAGLRGIDPDKVVFSSFEGSGYNDNPRSISEKLHELDPGVKQVWLLGQEEYGRVELPDYCVRAHSIGLDGLSHLATARVWVDNVRKNTNHLFRRGRQIYFNTWHGDRGFKRVGKDNAKKRYEPRLERFCSAMIAGSEFGCHTYRTAFEFEGEVLMDGCPRNDILVRDDPDVALALRKSMGFDAETGLLVYAPTYRDDRANQDQRAEIDIPRTLDCLERKTGRPWKCLLRLHYLSGGIDVGARDGRVVDMCGWPDMAELLAVADMLITDYSSCAGDFILRNKPAILYQSDIEDYRQGSRELYVDMDEAPFFIAHDMDGLEAIIEGLTEASVRENCDQWRAFFGVTETGHASEAAARYILRAMGRPAKE